MIEKLSSAAFIAR